MVKERAMFKIGDKVKFSGVTGTVVSKKIVKHQTRYSIEYEGTSLPPEKPIKFLAENIGIWELTKI